MRRTLKNMLSGFQDNFTVLSQTEYIIPSRRGFSEDAARLRGDFYAVARDMRVAVDRVQREHGEKNVSAG
jgi:hypothetical protein